MTWFVANEHAGFAGGIVQLLEKTTGWHKVTGTMRLEECYRMLDLTSRASPDEVRRAWRELTRVWHPDRFGHDELLRRRAEEKLKAINEAYAAIRKSGSSEWAESSSEGPGEPSRGASIPQGRTSKRRQWAFTCTLLALFILSRRPTPGALIVAVALFVAAAVFFFRPRRI